MPEEYGQDDPRGDCEQDEVDYSVDHDGLEDTLAGAAHLGRGEIRPVGKYLLRVCEQERIYPQGRLYYTADDEKALGRIDDRSELI